MTTRAYIGLGSNLDDPVEQVTSALAQLGTLRDTQAVHHSGLYQSKPLASTVDQADYINAVAALDTTLPPRQLLAELLDIEQAHGRIRTAERWGPRSLDLDLLLYGDLYYQDDALTLPHPRLHERSFVLYPLFEITPELVIPAHGSLRELLKHCPKHAITRLNLT